MPRTNNIEAPPDETPEVIQATDPIDDPSSGVKPWHRQDGESDAEWRAWVMYRALPPGERSAVRVSKALFPANGRKARNGERTGVSSVIESYASRWKWRDRIKALDVWRDEQAELAEVEALRADARARMVRERELRTNRDALAEKLARRLDILASGTNADGSPAGLDGSQAKAHRELVLAAERLRLVEDGGRAGLEKIIEATVAKALPKPADSELPESIPADVAAGVLALLATCGDH